MNGFEHLVDFRSVIPDVLGKFGGSALVGHICPKVDFILTGDDFLFVTWTAVQKLHHA